MFTMPGITVKPSQPDNWLEGGEAVTAAGIPFTVTSVPGHSPGHLAYHADGHLFSGDVLFAGSVGRTDLPGGDWRRAAGLDRDPAGRLPSRDRRPPGPRPGDDARRRARAQPVPRRPARVEAPGMSGKIERPRGTHDVVPAEMPVWQRVTGEVERLCALYGYRKILTPVFEDTALFARTSGQGSDVVQKEMYTFTDRSDRSLTLRPEGTAPICRAYVEHGMHRDPQPQKLFTIAPMYRYGSPGRGRYREHWQASRRGDRHPRPGDRRRADPAVRHASASPRRRRLPPGAQLDRLPGVPPGLPRDAPRLARGEREPPRCGHQNQGRDEPAARLRQLPREARRRPCRARRGAEDRRVALRRLRRALRRRQGRPRRDRGRVHARSDPRPRARLLHPHHVGVHRPDGQRELHHLRRRALRRARRGDRRPTDTRGRLRRRARAAADRDGGRGGERRAGRDRCLLRARGRRSAPGGDTVACRATRAGRRRRHRLCGALAERPADPGRPTRRRGDRRRRPGKRGAPPPRAADEPIAPADIVGRLSG